MPNIIEKLEERQYFYFLEAVRRCHTLPLGLCQGKLNGKQTCISSSNDYVGGWTSTSTQ